MRACACEWDACVSRNTPVCKHTHLLRLRRLQAENELRRVARGNLRKSDSVNCVLLNGEGGSCVQFFVAGGDGRDAPVLS